MILGAGTLGSTEILLRSRDKGLALSDRLGANFSGNGDALGFAYDSYLKAGRGMDNLRQTGKLFGVDTLMLLSLDQRFRPEDSGGVVRIRTATGSRDVNLPSQTVLTYIDVVMIDLASGEAGYTRQVASELGVDARTWADPRLRRQAETDATASALEKLRLALATAFAPKKKK